MKHLTLIGLILTSSLGFALADLPQTPEQWKAKQSAANSSASSDEWWKVFHDTKLTALIDEARSNYPGLKALMGRVEQARAAVRIARSAKLPQVIALSDISRSRASDTVYQFSFGTLSNFGAAAELSYELDIWGRVRGQVNAAKSDADSALADTVALRLMLAGEVARIYFALQSIDEENVVLRDTLKLRHEALDMATVRVNAGATNELDRVRAEAELATTEAEIAALVGPRAELENTLALVLGKNASGFKVAAGKLPTQSPAVPRVLPAELVRRRPDIASAMRRVESAQSRIGVARATYFPKVTLGAGIGTQTSDRDRVFDHESNTWSAGFRVSVPLFVGGQRKAAEDAARGGLQEATGSYEEKVLTAFKEVESVMANLNAQQRQADAQEHLQTAADAAAKLARQRYTEGVTTYLEVIEAERTALAARRALVQLHGLRLTTTVHLIQALGGGWVSEK